jgi:hypothetical protein
MDQSVSDGNHAAQARHWSTRGEFESNHQAKSLRAAHARDGPGSLLCRVVSRRSAHIRPERSSIGSQSSVRHGRAGQGRADTGQTPGRHRADSAVTDGAHRGT